MQKPPSSDLQTATFDYRYSLAFQSEQIAGEVERNLQLDFDEINHDIENSELRNFHLEPSMALLEMMHGQAI